MQRAHVVARKNLQVNAKRRKDFYDIKAKLNSYAEYDKVWYLNEVRKEGVCQKLQPLYLGPCLILQKLSDLNYKIQLDGQGTMKIVNHDKLKLSNLDLYPNWSVLLVSRILSYLLVSY
jgi:hypothetical protein